jgi:hypothetical protein
MKEKENFNDLRKKIMTPVFNFSSFMEFGTVFLLLYRAVTPIVQKF